MANWFEDLLIELRYKLIKRFAQECCANCRYQNKTRGNLDYFVLTPGDATQVRGRVCSLDTYLHQELDKCGQWAREEEARLRG